MCVCVCLCCGCLLLSGHVLFVPVSLSMSMSVNIFLPVSLCSSVPDTQLSVRFWLHACPSPCTVGQGTNLFVPSALVVSTEVYGSVGPHGKEMTLPVVLCGQQAVPGLASFSGPLRPPAPSVEGTPELSRDVAFFRSGSVGRKL